MANATSSTNTAEVKTSQLRLLILSPASGSQTAPSPFSTFLHSLTGTKPAPDLSAFAGYTSHPPLHLKTKYYETNITLWCDELPVIPSTDSRPSKAANTELDVRNASAASQSTSVQSRAPPTSGKEPALSDWKEQMLGPTAREVREVIGGIVIILPHADATTSATMMSDQITRWSKYIETVTALRDAIEDDSGRDVASIVVLQDMTPKATSIAEQASTKTAKDANSLLEKVEEECLNNQGIIGWDYVGWKTGSESQISGSATDNQTRNEFGEKTGFPRIIEVLEGTDWTANSASFDPDDPDNNDDEEDIIGSSPPATRSISNDPSFQLNLTAPMSSTDTNLSNEFQREMLGLKMAMLDIDKPSSTPSSLAGEYDVGDFGMRTPLQQPRPPKNPRKSRLATSTSNSQLGDEDEQNTESETEEDPDKSGEGDALKVEQLSQMMDRAVAVRETAEGMEPKQREKFARREVGRIMKELG